MMSFQVIRVGSNPISRSKVVLTRKTNFGIFFLTKERKMENRKKYELKIIIDTENVDFLAETLTNYCQECFNKDNPCEHSYFKCPLGEIGCYDVKPEDWKKVLKPLDNDAK